MQFFAENFHRTPVDLLRKPVFEEVDGHLVKGESSVTKQHKRMEKFPTNFTLIQAWLRNAKKVFTKFHSTLEKEATVCVEI